MAAVDDFIAVVFGYANAREQRLETEKLKLAHYTTASTALSILEGRALWMRNATVMNDHMEIQHGHSIVSAALAGPPGQKLMQVLGQIAPQYAGNTPQLLPLTETDKSEIFMTSLAEHKADDRLGRLSMWRAYGGREAGVAIVFNTDVIKNPAVNLATVASPVMYGGVAEFNAQLDGLCERLKKSASLVQSIPIEMGGMILGQAIQYAYMSIKHEGFAEEEEWRLIHRPFVGAGNAWVHSRIASIRGIPQLLYELPLGNIHDGMSFSGFSLDALIHRVIIGPSLFPTTVRRAFTDMLKSRGVSNAEAKVVVSDIPLRQWS